MRADASPGRTTRRLLIVTFLLAIPGIAAITAPRPGSWWPGPDIWWHLRTADWILEHAALPTTDPFSAFGSGRPWAAYSWLFELLVHRLHDTWGLMGVLGYALAASVAVGAALYVLVRGLLPNFTGAVAIAMAGVASLVPVVNPRPWLVTILLFFLELHVLLTARRTGNMRLLWLLPPMFVLWANVHIQFVYGLGVLGLALLAVILEPVVSRGGVEVERSTVSATRLFLVLLVCIAATFVGPYHVHLYRVIFEYVTQSGVFSAISELLAMQFRDPADWVVLALTLAAMFALGRQQPLQLFPMLVVLAGAALAFRARRDVWFLVGGTCMVLASSAAAWLPHDPFRITKFRATVIAAGVALLVAGVGYARGMSESRLTTYASERYPIEAAAFVEKHQLPGPLYNHFDWGGYLMWRLPQYPVSMDGRTNVHLPERVARSRATWTGAPEWRSDPELGGAGLVVASVDVPLTSLLRGDARFEAIYEDDVAVVFVATPSLRHPLASRMRAEAED
ncbi:MAG: hypothetical protein AMS20_08635 [Gemmatimonas sp. SG8_28]|nr:MAG: hypothetical protein AMS20_08635 [Gemmatimonas sp. SG8_28]